MIKIIGTPLHQWETGRKVAITPPRNTRFDCVRFANFGVANDVVVMPQKEGGLTVAYIPDELLQTGRAISAYLARKSGEGFENVYDCIFPVKKRAKPNSEAVETVAQENGVMTVSAAAAYLLNQHIHEVTDMDAHFEIDGATRTVKNAAESKKMVAQYDHNSERFTFTLPRMIEGHDMTACDAVRIHYLNVDSDTQRVNPGVYEVDDLDVFQDDDEKVSFSWLISDNATQYAGSLHFTIRFSCSSADGADYIWNTAIYSGITVIDGINNGDAIAQGYPDVLEQWRATLFDLDSSAFVSAERAEQAYKNALEVENRVNDTTGDLMGVVSQVEEAARVVSDAKDAVARLAAETETNAATASKARDDAQAAASRVAEISQGVENHAQNVEQLAGEVTAAAEEVAANKEAVRTIASDVQEMRTATEAAKTAAEAAAQGVQDVIDETLETATLAKEAVEQVGKEVDTLREVVSAMHDNIVCDATGSEIVLDDSSDLPLKGLRIFGRTTQDGTPSLENPVPLVSPGDDGDIWIHTIANKNLLYPRRVDTQTINDVTFTINADKSVAINGTATLDADFYVRVNSVWEYPDGSYYFPDTNFTKKNNKYYSANTPENAIYIKSGDMVGAFVRVWKGETANGVTKFPMCLRVDSPAAPYEPYKGGTVTIPTPNGLPGIKVDSGGNYTDAMGQQWICDEVDFARGVYVKRIADTAGKSWNKHNIANGTTGERYAMAVVDRVSENYSEAMCSHYLYRNAPSFSREGDYLATDEENFVLIRCKDKLFGTSGAFNQWVNETGMVVYYQLKTPTETPLTPEQLNAYKALHTNYPNTYILNDAGADMAVQYVADTKSYIDKKFDQLAVAMLNR